MKGVAIAVILILTLAFLVGCGVVVATSPLVPPVQFEQYCDSQKVSGTGVIDASTSIVDKQIALEYSNTMSGDGDIEIDQERAYSQDADKLQRNVSSVNGGNNSALNLYDSEKLTYQGDTPLTGGKSLKSDAFYGGIGAQVQEMYSVNQMEKDQTTYFSSTTPYNPNGVTTPSVTTPEQTVQALKSAGRDQNAVGQLMSNFGDGTVSNPAHLVGMDTKASFNGTWGTDATWHQIFYKDIKAHEMFTGQFEAEKSIKFHENPVPENEQAPCAGIDC
ncbi:MAG: hypothetical protein WB392_00300 [Methanotrichaceae archaeon]